MVLLWHALTALSHYNVAILVQLRALPNLYHLRMDLATEKVKTQRSARRARVY